MRLIVCRALVLLLVSALISVQAPVAVGQSVPLEPLDPRLVALDEPDLPAGFSQDYAQRQRQDVPDGGVKLSATFRRDRRYGGIWLVRNTVWSMPGPGPAVTLFRGLPDLLAGQGFAPVEAPQLGDESLAFESPEIVDGDRALYATVAYRHGPLVVMTTTLGPAETTGVVDAAALAGVTYSRASELVAVRPPAVVFGPDPAAPASASSSEPAAPADETPDGPPGIVASGTLVDAPDLGDNLRLGGFSGLVAADRTGTLFWSLTDRGPNDQIKVRGEKRMTFPLPGFTPSLLKVELRDGQVRVLDRVPLRLRNGYRDLFTGSALVSGICNGERDEPPFSKGAKKTLDFDPYGLDTEGMAVDPRDGSFWVAEEYGPSILKVGSDGVIQLRLVPEGWGLDAPGQGTREILPGALLKRKQNRGFEGVGLSPDGSTLLAIMQSPLSDPNEKAGEASRIVRLLTLDVSGQPRVTGMYAYVLEDAADVGVDEQDDVKIGDLTALSATSTLVIERDSLDNGPHRVVYRVDLSGATNLLGKRSFGGRTLEQLSPDELARQGVTPVVKTRLVSLREYGYGLEKVEGLARVDDRTIAVVNDNDFGFAGFEPSGRALPSNVPTRLALVRLPEPLR